MATFRSVRSVLVVALLGGACSSILGMEDIHDGPDPSDAEGGENGSGGSSSGQGGSSGTSGSSGSSGASGTAGNGGSSGDTGGTGTGGTGGDAGGGSGGDGTTGGTAGTAGTGGVGDPTVRGRIITTWMQPVPNITVMIGDAEADTNANGEFEIPDVAATYDAKFVLNYDLNGIRTYGYVYLGLTRRDPTLQVYRGLPGRSTNISATPQNLTGTDFTNRTLLLGLGSPEGYNNYEIDSPAGIGQSGATWQGPEVSNVTAHALLFEYDANSLPTTYRSYDQSLGVLSDTQALTSFLLNVPDETVGSGTVSGTVTSPTSSDRTNYVYLRFESHASMELVEHYGSSLNPGTFTYAIPSVQGGSVEVGASEGTWSYSPVGVAHRDRLATGQMDVALEIPTPAQQVAPADQITGVDGATIFSWSSQARTFVWNAENAEPSSPYGGMYIVTAEKRASIPEFPNGFTLIPGDLYNWRVEVHGDAASVNELAGPEGFADSWAPYGEGPNSPRRGDGTYSISGGRLFTTAP